MTKWGCGCVCNSVNGRESGSDCWVEPLGVCRGRFGHGEVKNECNFGDLLYDTECKRTNTKGSSDEKETTTKDTSFEADKHQE